MSDIWGLPIYVKTHISQNKFYIILASIWLAKYAHILNGYDIGLNTTNIPIFNLNHIRVHKTLS